MVQRSSTDPAEHTRNDGGPSTTRVRLRAMLSAALVARWFAASCYYQPQSRRKGSIGLPTSEGDAHGLQTEGGRGVNLMLVRELSPSARNSATQAAYFKEQ